jgi:hypothetical protein
MKWSGLVEPGHTCEERAAPGDNALKVSETQRSRTSGVCAEVLAAIFVTTTFAVFFALTFVAWKRYLWAAEKLPQADTCPYSLTDVFGDRHLVNVPHQEGVRWLPEVFSRSAEKFPDLPALQIPHTFRFLSWAWQSTTTARLLTTVWLTERHRISHPFQRHGSPPNSRHGPRIGRPVRSRGRGKRCPRRAIWFGSTKRASVEGAVLLRSACPCSKPHV